MCEELFYKGSPTKNAGACWTDTKWYFGEIGRHFSSANICYCILTVDSGLESTDEKTALEVANKIVQKANAVGLQVSWNGDTNAAVSVGIE